MKAKKKKNAIESEKLELELQCPVSANQGTHVEDSMTNNRVPALTVPVV